MLLLPLLLAAPAAAQVRSIPPVKTGAMALFSTAGQIEPMSLVRAGILPTPAAGGLRYDQGLQIAQYGQLVGMMSENSPVVALADGALIGFVAAEATPRLPHAGFTRLADPSTASFGAASRAQLAAIHELINAGDAVAALVKLRDLFPK